MKAAILGIGTELTDGQIVNKNAAWISKKLKELGLTTRLQLAVPDEKALMLEGIKYCAENADLIFITGGLGPTSDDFTRDVVASWADTKMHFDDASWQHIIERLSSRGYTVKEIQRQQCYFPEGSQILQNTEGTANGFLLKAHGKDVFVLPGPPREIEAVWNSGIHAWLKQHTKNLDPFITRTWDTLGVGESDVALITEEVLKNISVEKGYRVHLPYVEIKTSYLQSRAQELEEPLNRLSEALNFCTISRDGADIAEQFAQGLEDINSLCLIDEVTGQFLLNRLMPSLRRFQTEQKWNFASSREMSSPAELQLQLLPKDEHSCEVILQHRGRKVKDLLHCPYKTMNMKERRRQYFAEMALIFWQKNLT